MQKEVTIIGGGIIGLFCAYYLHKSGHSVRLIEASDTVKGASMINAGLFCPSHFIPLASPGMIMQSFKWILNPSSPLYVKPRWNTGFFKWGYHFAMNANQKNVDKSMIPLYNITLYGKTLFEDFLTHEEVENDVYSKRGLLMIYNTETAERKESLIAEKAATIGLDAKSLNREQLLEIEPSIGDKVRGAVHFTGDSHSTPKSVVDSLLDYLKNNGVSLHFGERVIDIVLSNGKISKIKTNLSIYSPDEVVLAAGAWSSGIAKMMGIHLMLEAGKGYKMDLNVNHSIQNPAILIEPQVAITPMKGFLRITGRMELMGLDTTIRKRGIDSLAVAAGTYYKGLSVTKSNIEGAECGFRPLTPDGLPYIGRSLKVNNLCIATGHGMLGWTMATATGKLIAETIDGESPSLSMESFLPDRKL